MQFRTRKKNRLFEYDYRSPNAYFITICTDRRRNLFWTDAGAIIDLPRNVPLSRLGTIAEQSIRESPKHYPSITVDHYVVMPNHIHLLLQIHSDVHGRSMIAPTISTVVKQMKGAATKRAGFPIWQKGFYDHVVRDDADYRKIWEYIEGNPGRWTEDKLYVPSPIPF